MERKSKKIVAGMMAGFSVLSTQSILGSFQKLPMGGGCNLISYAETGNSTSVSVTIEVDASNPKNYKGTLKYKINFGSKTDNFAINTILRNSGVKKAVADADGKTNVWAKDVSETALKIAGTERFFKAKADGGSSLIGFKLTAKYADTSGASKREELLLNTTQECITAYDENGGVQEGNTYQIINKDDVYSKLYWGADGGKDANKLIFEIPIELPEKVKVENQDHSIKAFKISVSHMDSECIEEHAEQLDASAQSKGIRYTLDSENKTAAVASSESTITEAIIPKYVKDTSGNKYEVTSIAAANYNNMENKFVGGFANCSNLTSVEIPDSVTSIGWNAFQKCSALTSVEIPDSVKSIGEGAFQKCSALTSVVIGNGLESIEVNMFQYCNSLKSVTIPNNVSSIEKGAFQDCSSLASVEIVNGVTTIEKNAFNCCNALTSVTIPGSVTSIGESAFSNCSNLTSVEIGSGVTTIKNYAFYRCSSLNEITIKSTELSSIGSDAFRAVSSTGTIYIPDSKREDTAYQALFTSKGLPSGWTFKNLSEKPAE